MAEALMELADLKARVLKGDDVSADEYHHVVESIRKDRTAAAKGKAKKKAKEPDYTIIPKDLKTLFSEDVKD